MCCSEDMEMELHMFCECELPMWITDRLQTVRANDTSVLFVYILCGVCYVYYGSYEFIRTWLVWV